MKYLFWYLGFVAVRFVLAHCTFFFPFFPFSTRSKQGCCDFLPARTDKPLFAVLSVNYSEGKPSGRDDRAAFPFVSYAHRSLAHKSQQYGGD